MSVVSAKRIGVRITIHVLGPPLTETSRAGV